MPNAKLNDPIDIGARELRPVDPQAKGRLRDLGAALMPLHRLKRTGAGPFLFNGRTVATACGITPALPFWYEINIHRTVIDTFVTDVRLFWKSGDLSDAFRVAEHDDLPAAAAHLERYAPDQDAVVPPEFAQAGSTAAVLALAAARLQLQLEQLRGHYRAMLGDLLHSLDPAD